MPHGIEMSGAPKKKQVKKDVQIITEIQPVAV